MYANIHSAQLQTAQETPKASSSQKDFDRCSTSQQKFLRQNYSLGFEALPHSTRFDNLEAMIEDYCTLPTGPHLIYPLPFRTALTIGINDWMLSGEGESC